MHVNAKEVINYPVVSCDLTPMSFALSFARTSFRGGNWRTEAENNFGPG
jgi:hypothetical protein